MLKIHYKPSSKALTERYRFMSRKQNQGKSVTQFLAETAMGELKSKIEYNIIKVEHIFPVTHGRDLLHKIKVDWSKIAAQCKIVLKDDATPKFMIKSRPIPYAIQKKHGEFNNFTQYPIATPEQIFHSVSGSSIFTKLDIQKKGLAIIFALKKFYIPVWSSFHSIITDHKSLLNIFKILQVDESTVSKRLKGLGMIQMQGHWVPYELKPRDVERRFGTCELLLQRQKRKGFLIPDRSELKEPFASSGPDTLTRPAPSRMTASQKSARVIQHAAKYIAALTMEPYVLSRMSSPNRSESILSAAQDGQNNSVCRCRMTMHTNQQCVKLYLKKVGPKHDPSKSGLCGLYEYTENKEWNPPSPTLVKTQPYFNIIPFHIIVPFTVTRLKHPPEC
ncbi:MOS1T transposase, partial [Pseudoatta argentina]